MSREASEQDPKRQYEDNFPKGAGDPDAYGYPGEPVAVRVTRPKLIQDVRPADVIMKEALAQRPF